MRAGRRPLQERRELPAQIVRRLGEVEAGPGTPTDGEGAQRVADHRATDRVLLGELTLAQQERVVAAVAGFVHRRVAV